MTIIFFLFVFPSLILADIRMNLRGRINGTEWENLRVSYNGDNQKILRETKFFNLENNQLLDAVKICHGARPDNAYLHSPTPWGDLYKSYGWDQVTWTLKPSHGKVLNFSSEQFSILPQVYENNGPTPTTVSIGFYQPAFNKVTSYWKTTGALNADSVRHNFYLDIANGGAIQFVYTSLWGQNTEQLQKVILGTASPLQFVLNPGQSVVAQLYFTTGRVFMEMIYDVSVAGDIALNYNQPFKGHHFWMTPIKDCMMKAKLEFPKQSYEVISFEFYANSKLVLHNRKYDTKITEISF